MNFLKKILKTSRAEQDGIFFGKIYKITGFKPQNLDVYQRAFTHRSANKIDEKGNIISYERLEFLGDAMLGSVIAAHLFNQVPNQDEGYLTKMRSKIVSRENLNNLGKDLGLIDLVSGKVVSQKQFGENIYGNLFEALVGAIYLDRGYLVCEKFIQKKLIMPYVDIEKLEGKIISYKSLLIEWCQKNKKTFELKTGQEDSADVQKHFWAQLYIDNKVVAKARATSKKKAEEIASKRAYFSLQNHIETKNK